MAPGLRRVPAAAARGRAARCAARWGARPQLLLLPWGRGQFGTHAAGGIGLPFGLDAKDSHELRAWELPSEPEGLGKQLTSFEEVEESRMDMDGGQIWVHIDPTCPVHCDWLRQRSGLPPAAADILLADGLLHSPARADTFASLEGSPAVLLCLRGVRRVPGADRDFVSLRLWCEEGLLISSRVRRLKGDPAARTKSCFDAATLPCSVGEVLAVMVSDLVRCCEAELHQERENMSALEADMAQLQANPPWFFTSALSRTRRRVAAARLNIAEVKRYLGGNAPDVGCIAALPNSDDPRKRKLVTTRQASRIRTDCATLTTIDRELRALVARGVLLHEEAAICVMEQLNKSMYLIALLTVVCLPLAAAANALALWREVSTWGTPSMAAVTASAAWGAPTLAAAAATVSAA
eukprot:TRINITY_DN70639_c0_g1_i1.p1 TRINITY_DN70639_c0_g1~~TRINITY_DN70639_c0_g1_i1.p1  ORF type:complete len:437 (+),score=133.51 TRINITY_DN70639_c0_g1_i1:88-1311(+)